jgi:DNA topoisomerase III
MKKSLILAEKPSVGRDIARVLGCQKGNQGYFENSQYVVTWALGHLVTLAAPEKYKKDYATWSFDTLPMLPKPFKLEVIQQTSKQFQQVKSLMQREDISEIIIATDAGREGELVARWIIAYAQCKKPIKRLWVSSVTDKAIQDGFKNLVDGSKYNRLYKAAEARACADWIVGINGTRALTCKHNASLSMGRVQTPTLGLVNEREIEIRSFKPQTFFEILAYIGDFNVRWIDTKTGQSRIVDQTKAQNILDSCKNQEAIVKSYQETIKKTYPKGLYDLTELQRDADRLYNYSAKETLSIMQSLYERHKVLTYPRTDSKYLTTDIVDTLSERVRACRQGSYRDICSEILRTPIKGNPSFVDNAKVGDHHGIIPTEQVPIFSNFDVKEQKIYNLVLKRFLSVLMPPQQYKEISIELAIGLHSFKGKGRLILDLGWKKVYEAGILDTSDDDDQPLVKSLSVYKPGDKVKLNGSKIAIGTTNPPKFLTEGDILFEMEKSGLGTVATRADIIEKIIDNHYVEKQDKYLKTTKTGRQLLELVPVGIKSKELTSSWEKKLEAIAKGQLDDKAFIEEMTQYTVKIVQEIKQDTHEFRHENVSTESCPTCGQKLLVISNKNGKKLVCRDRNCDYSKNVSKKTNARCPECKKPLDLIGEGELKTFICRCGYKEKLSSFNLRVEKRSNQMSKKEVQSFLSKTDKKEEAFNNPFAQLLGDMNKTD